MWRGRSKQDNLSIKVEKTGFWNVISCQKGFLAEKVLERLWKEFMVHLRLGLFQTSPKWQPQAHTCSRPSIFGFSQQSWQGLVKNWGESIISSSLVLSSNLSALIMPTQDTGSFWVTLTGTSKTNTKGLNANRRDVWDPPIVEMPLSAN